MTSSLVVLARSPEPGEGKMRLRADLGDCPAAAVDELVRGLVADTLARASRGRRTLVVSGRGDAAALVALAGPAARLVEQPDTGFGERIEAALVAGLATGAAVTAQIGTDSPTLPGALVDAAVAAVEAGSGAALVPATDGGWVALAVGAGLDGALATAHVRWSTGHAAADTVRALRAHGLAVAVLPPWYDVDDHAGLRRLVADPSAKDLAPRSLRSAARLGLGAPNAGVASA